MHRPDVHLEYHRERHADLLRQARDEELAVVLARSRREERRTLLARLWRDRHVGRPAPATP